jgi:hypothetical protein
VRRLAASGSAASVACKRYMWRCSGGDFCSAAETSSLNSISSDYTASALLLTKFTDSIPVEPQPVSGVIPIAVKRPLATPKFRGPRI